MVSLTTQLGVVPALAPTLTLTVTLNPTLFVSVALAPALIVSLAPTLRMGLEVMEANRHAALEAPIPTPRTPTPGPAPTYALILYPVLP